MGRKRLIETQEGNKMTFTNDFSARIMAALAAVTVTTSLLISSFSTPEASIFAGLIA